MNVNKKNMERINERKDLSVKKISRGWIKNFLLFTVWSDEKATSAGCVWWICNVVSGHFSRIVEEYKVSIIPIVFGYNY